MYIALIFIEKCLEIAEQNGIIFLQSGIQLDEELQKEIEISNQLKDNLRKLRYKLERLNIYKSQLVKIAQGQISRKDAKEQ